MLLGSLDATILPVSKQGGMHMLAFTERDIQSVLPLQSMYSTASGGETALTQTRWTHQSASLLQGVRAADWGQARGLQLGQDRSPGL